MFMEIWQTVFWLIFVAFIGFGIGFLLATMQQARREARRKNE
jgi:general stress protein CsbA